MRVCLACNDPVPTTRRADAVYCGSEPCERVRGAARQTAYYRRNPQFSQKRWRNYYRSDRGTITALLGNAKDRALRGGFEFDLDREFIATKLAAGVCEFTGLAFEREWSGENYRARPFAPSLDRIVPALGYVKSNVRMVCFAVNMALSDWGDEAFVKIAQAVVTKYGTN